MRSATSAVHHKGAICPGLLLVFALGVNAAAQNPVSSTPASVAGVVLVPASSVARPEDAGVRAHTNYLIFQPAGTPSPQTAPAGEIPASLGCVYRVGPIYAGCNPKTGGTRHPSGGSGAIVLVDAYDNPDAATDLDTFNTQFGIPKTTFTQVYCVSGGSCAPNNPPPPVNSSWGLEEALDIEWAHAMAPNAQIYLVEAASNSISDLLNAEYYAELALIGTKGGGQIANSWGTAEFSGETGDDSYFNLPGSAATVYTASSGNIGGSPQWPSTSPFVVSSGGTSVNRDSSGNFLNESCSSGSGGGGSLYEPAPPYQQGLGGKSRLTPDISFDGSPSSGVAVYDALNGGWFVVGGTSVGAPSLAGIINLAGDHMPATYQQQLLMYGELWGAKTYPGAWNDIVLGQGAGPGWDACTGIGTPHTAIGK
jgi:kumamolisin